MAIIQLEGLSRHYGEDETLVKALDEVSISIEQGEIVALLGPSGSGKTTLLNTIAALDVPTNGTYLFNEEEVPLGHVEKMTTFRRENIGYIFQFYNLLPNLTVLENAALGLELKGESLDGAKEILQRVGLGDKSHRFPAQLSGGEQQRVAISRAMAKNPALIVADEPTGNLDRNNSASVRAMFKDISKESTIIIATHDNDYLEIADKAYELEEGKLKKIK